MLISPLNAFPWVLNGLVESWVSLKRVKKFLEMEELDFGKYYLPGMVYRNVYGHEPGRDISSELISIVDGCFTWRRKDCPKEENVPSSAVPDSVETTGVGAGDSSVEWLLDSVNLKIKKVCKSIWGCVRVFYIIFPWTDNSKTVYTSLSVFVDG